MNAPEKKTHNAAFRIPVGLLTQIDALADRLSGEMGFKVTRTQVLIHILNTYFQVNP